ncbi:hypothetical protein [Rhodococcoides kyotonense]|uniref:Uncharacterized protein n=1 Tax=Rhodococcoides kyotonense TaxID=398843 RepID=A0A177YH37_9NOCA|nr:hypothetical protein [Rhodococcus kyotonensis]OAK54852.1 hypothetical protein A3K89_05945 [Rhodococcus kyotonensis]
MTLNGWLRQLPYTQPDVIVVDYFGVLANPDVADNWIAGYAMGYNTHPPTSGASARAWPEGCRPTRCVRWSRL